MVEKSELDAFVGASRAAEELLRREAPWVVLPTEEFDPERMDDLRPLLSFTNEIAACDGSSAVIAEFTLPLPDASWKRVIESTAHLAAFVYLRELSDERWYLREGFPEWNGVSPAEASAAVDQVARLLSRMVRERSLLAAKDATAKGTSDCEWTAPMNMPEFLKWLAQRGSNVPEKRARENFENGTWVRDRKGTSHFFRVRFADFPTPNDAE